MGRINKNLKKGKNLLFVLTMFYIKPQLLSLGTHTVADMNRKSISLFALSALVMAGARAQGVTIGETRRVSRVL